MKNAPLTARYRPQSFAEVAGQQTIKAILSRAAAEDKVAPAYLFSGTRGVGKTTIARIFAKALNCRQAPAAEPCNECDLCKAVTQGAAIDVVEIDGASNRGIDDVRRLKEVVGYAPMDGRYKVFIIDEAHMLSRDAFNALLKTLEEPPAGVTFIMATTEPHKFPATVVSRCQHFVFKRLSEQELVDHLTHVLTQEDMAFEPQAVRLIARRGAGSVRDSMSLLGQVLAFGADSLTQETTRMVLGLAGQETFVSLLEAIREGNTLDLVQSLRLFLEQGLDIGFFLRELANAWREMFILRQSGEAGLVAVDMPQEEARIMLALSQKFSLPHIHACWQMTLEGQRRVQSSLEPGLALELLLLNLAMLPQLMPLDSLSSLARRAHVPPSPTSPTQGGGGDPRGEPSAVVSEGSLATASAPHLSPVFPLGEEAEAGSRVSDHEADDTHRNNLADGLGAAKNSDGAADGKASGGAQSFPSSPEDVLESGVASHPSGVFLGGASGRSPASSLSASDSRENGDYSPPAGGGNGASPHSLGREDSSGVKSSSCVSGAQNAPDFSGAHGSFASPQSAESSGTPVISSPASVLPVSGTVTNEETPQKAEPSGEGVPLARPMGKTGENSEITASSQNHLEGRERALDIGIANTAEGGAGEEEDDEDDSESLTAPASGGFLPAWGDVVARAQEQEGLPWFGGLIQSITGSWDGNDLVLKVDSDFIGSKIMEPATKVHLEALLKAMMGRVPSMRVNVVKETAFDKESVKEAMYENPTFKELEEILSARIIDFGRIHK